MSATTLHDAKAEAYVLAAYLSGKAGTISAGDVQPRSEWFHEPAHRAVFEAVHALFHGGDPVTLVTVSRRLREEGLLDAVGGDDFLAEITETYPTPTRLERHLRILQDMALRRLLRQAVREIGANVEDEGKDVLEIAADTEQRILDITKQGAPDEARDIRTLVAEAIDDIGEVPDEAEISAMPGRRCDYDSVNEKLGGFRPGNLVILASRPGEGKSALAINLAFQVGWHARRPSLFFSLEMDRDQVSRRIFSSEATRKAYQAAGESGRPHRVELTDLDKAIEKGEMGLDARTQMISLILDGRLGVPQHHEDPAPLFIDDSPSRTVLQIKVEASRIKSRHGLAAVFVDYLQLVKPRATMRRERGRHEEVGEISRELKAMAKTLEVPVVAISQLSREIERREDRRPRLSDLRESGSLEQDADSVVFLHAPRVDPPIRATFVQLMVQKNRHGETGVLPFTFDKTTQMFWEGDLEYVAGRQYRPRHGA